MKELRFSERLSINNLFERECNRKNWAYCITNFMIYAEEKGWLNLDKIKKHLTPKRINKILNPKRKSE